MNFDAPLLVAFSTSNYDAMIRFLRDFGFAVDENPPGDQLVPFFEKGRGALVTRGDFEFQLEESKSPKSAAINLFFSLSEEEITRLKSLGYRCDDKTTIYGKFHSFHSPDGGRFVVQ